MTALDVLAYLRTHGPTNAARIAHALGITEDSAWHGVNRLHAHKLIWVQHRTDVGKFWAVADRVDMLFEEL